MHFLKSSSVDEILKHLLYNFYFLITFISITKALTLFYEAHGGEYDLQIYFTGADVPL